MPSSRDLASIVPPIVGAEGVEAASKAGGWGLSESSQQVDEFILHYCALVDPSLRRQLVDQRKFMQVVNPIESAPVMQPLPRKLNNREISYKIVSKMV